MSIFSLRIKIFSRSKRQNAVAAAAYRSGENLTDEKTGIVYRYRSRIDTVQHSEIIMPDGESLPEREWLWNSVERAEQRKNSQVAREVMVALPWTLTLSEQVSLVREFAKKEFVTIGMCADFNIHYKRDATGKDENPHCHILLSTREFVAGKFGKKRRDWNDRALAEQWRKSWETTVNECPHIIAHPSQKIDRRKLTEQRVAAKEEDDFELWWDLWRPPGKHRGKTAGFDLSGRGQKKEVGFRADREQRWQKRQKQIAAHEHTKTKLREALNPYWDSVKAAWRKKSEKAFVAWLVKTAKQPEQVAQRDGRVWSNVHEAHSKEKAKKSQRRQRDKGR